MKSFFSFPFVFLFVVSLAMAQGPKREALHIGLEEGLPQSQVVSMMLDSKGFMWIGTKGGLSRFDGHRLVNYSHKDGLPDADIAKIQEDSAQRIWLFSKKGISRVQGSRVITHPLPDNIKVIYGGEYGFIWKDGKIRLYTVKNKQLIGCVFENRNYSLQERIATPFRYHEAYDVISARSAEKNYPLVNATTKKKLPLKPDLNYIYYFLPDQKVMEWNIATETFQVIDISAVASPKRNDTYITNFIFPIFKGSNRAEVLSMLNLPMDINYMPYRLLIDNRKRTWVGSDGNGLFMYQKQLFSKAVSTETGTDQVWSVTEHDGLFYFGRYFDREHGLALWNESKDELKLMDIPLRVNYSTSTNFEGQPVWTTNWGTLHRRTDGSFWLDTLANTLHVYKDTIGRKLLYSTSIGLAVVDGKGGKKIYPVKLGSGLMLCSTRDKFGRYWTGNGSGIAYIENEEIVYPQDSITTKGARAILTDSLGNLWFGKNELYMYNYEKYRLVKHPLLEDKFITGLFQADEKHLLIGTSHGLAMLDLRYFYNRDSVRIKFYDRHNGFSTDECQQNSFFRDSKKRIWIPTMKAVWNFRPEDLGFDSIALPTYVTSVKYRNSEMNWLDVADSIRKFSPEQNNLRFEFTGIEFENPDAVRYQFLLDGNDTHWSPPTTESYVNFTNLNPGKYVFKVKSCNPDGQWSLPATRTFVVEAAFYQTALFKVLAALLFVLLTFLVARIIYKHQKRKLQAAHALKERMSHLEIETINNRLNPHFLNNSLQSAQIIAFQDDKDKIAEFIAQLGGMLDSVLRKEEYSHARKLTDELNFVKNYLYLQRIRFGEKLKYEIDIADDVDTQLNIPRMSIQILVENSIKHGILPKEKEGGTVWISARNVNGNLEITVRDNGIGIEAAKKNRTGGTGIGLSGIREIHNFLNRENSKKISFEISDYKIDGKVAGAQSVQRIPHGYNFL